MPLRSVKMNRFIFGFQRRVWCPKWTPLSSSCFMLTTAMPCSPSVLRAARRPRSSVVAGPGGDRPGVRSTTPPAVARRDRGGDCPARAAGERTREVDPSQTDRTYEHTCCREAASGRPRTSLFGPLGAGLSDRVDGVRTRLLLVAVCFLALLAPAPALAEPSPGEPVAAFGWPLAGSPPVTRPFEAPLGPFGPGHRGVDLAAAPGAPVLAAGPGVVAFAGMV